MKKLLLTILLTFFSTWAKAEWTLIGQNNKVTSYADKATISRSGNIANIWELLDFKSTQGSGSTEYLSIVLYTKFDCMKKMDILLSQNFYSENMGKGNNVMTINNDVMKWDYIVPRTLEEAALKAACGKK